MAASVCVTPASGCNRIEEHPERLNTEIKLRSNVVGIVPSAKSARRLVGAILLEQDDEWAVAGPYLGAESMKQLAAPWGARL